MSVPESENVASYAIVGFDSFMEAKTLLDRINRNSGKMKGSEFPRLEKVKAEIAPDPYDIDWNFFAISYTAKFHIYNVLFGILLFLICPVINFYLEYTLSFQLAKAM